MNKIPDKEGLNPYDGKEHPLHFPDDQFWDGIEWHGEALPPDSQNATLSHEEGGKDIL